MAEQNNEEKYQQKGGNNKTRLIIIICLVLVIVLLGIVIALLLKKNDQAAQPAAEEKRDVIVNEDNVDEIVDRMMSGSSTPTNYEVTMNSTWNFPSGSEASSDAYVENSTSNQNDVYFELELSGTGEKLYESPVIPVGNHLDKIKLDKDLEAGTYDCIMTYHLLDGDQNTVGTVKMAVTVIIGA